MPTRAKPDEAKVRSVWRPPGGGGFRRWADQARMRGAVATRGRSHVRLTERVAACFEDGRDPELIEAHLAHW